MFTQIKGINTNKCNGCDKQCTLGALQVTTIDGKQKYLPTKNNEVQIYTKDQHGNNRPLAKAYTTAHDAINAAKLLSHQCDDFTDFRIEKDQLTTPDIDCCIGCKHHCIFSSEIIRGIFVPKIGSKVIERYINAFGEIQTSHIFYDAFHAKMFAKNKIAHLCDNYQNRK